MSILIGVIHHREARHPHWSDTYDRSPEDNVHGTPRTAWQPYLHVGGMWLADFAWAALARARAGGMTWPEHVHPAPEDAYFRPIPGTQGEPDHAGGRVTIAACDCGEPECGSIYARMVPTTLGGVQGVMLSDFITRVDEQATLPLPRIFIPLSAWPENAEEPYWTLNRGEDVPRADRETMLRDARQAAEGLDDPWGRALETRHWLGVHRQALSAQWAEIRARPDAAALRVRLDKDLARLNADEAAARQGKHSSRGFVSLLDADPEGPEWIAVRLGELAEARHELQATFEAEVAELGMTSRDRRISRRARRRANAETRERRAARIRAEREAHWGPGGALGSLQELLERSRAPGERRRPTPRRRMDES